MYLDVHRASFVYASFQRWQGSALRARKKRCQMLGRNGATFLGSIKGKRDTPYMHCTAEREDAAHRSALVVC